MTCTCGHAGKPRCPDGEELYQAYRDAMEAEAEKGSRHEHTRSEWDHRALAEAMEARKAARKTWVDHKSREGVAAFRARLTEREREQ